MTPFSPPLLLHIFLPFLSHQPQKHTIRHFSLNSSLPLWPSSIHSIPELSWSIRPLSFSVSLAAAFPFFFESYSLIRNPQPWRVRGLVHLSLAAAIRPCRSARGIASILSGLMLTLFPVYRRGRCSRHRQWVSCFCDPSATLTDIFTKRHKLPPYPSWPRARHVDRISTAAPRR